jgi:hypothetical protein
MATLARRWQRRFDEAAPVLARRFAARFPHATLSAGFAFLLSLRSASVICASLQSLPV